jgi:hypothetical protein
MLRHQTELAATSYDRSADTQTIPAVEIYLDRTYVPSLGNMDETERLVLRDDRRRRLLLAINFRETHGLARQQAIAETLRDIEGALKEVTTRESCPAQNVKQSYGKTRRGLIQSMRTFMYFSAGFQSDSEVDLRTYARSRPLLAALLTVGLVTALLILLPLIIVALWFCLEAAFMEAAAKTLAKRIARWRRTPPPSGRTSIESTEANVR